MDLTPLVKTVRVPLAPPAAFALFTDEIGTWWPLATHSIGQGAATACAFEGRVGGRIFETLADGGERPWGSVTAWEPPRRVAFRWHPGREPDGAQIVEVTFEDAGVAGTTVRLEHRDWHVFGEDAATKRAEYDQGWDGVLGEYARLAAAEKV
jgi:uncharacterized protein YndB with AHSA1/START domain